MPKILVFELYLNSKLDNMVIFKKFNNSILKLRILESSVQSFKLDCVKVKAKKKPSPFCYWNQHAHIK